MKRRGTILAVFLVSAPFAMALGSCTGCFMGNGLRPWGWVGAVVGLLIAYGMSKAVVIRSEEDDEIRAAQLKEARRINRER